MKSRFRIALVAAVPVVALAAAGCGGSSKPTVKAPPPASHAAPSAHTSSTPASASASSTPRSGLSGTWAGQYSGAYNGKFSLNWTQSGSNLSGKITLSSPPETTGITGSVSGGTIKFGTVSGAVYNGTLSGNSMGGSYQTPTGGGSWSANKA